MNNRNIWRTAFLPSTLVGLILIVALTFYKGKPGTLGSLLGFSTVIIFFSVHLIVQRISRDIDPIAVMALALFSYFSKVVLMGAFLVIVSKISTPDSVNRASFAISALTVTVIWLAAEIRAFLRLRPQLPLPKSNN